MTTKQKPEAAQVIANTCKQAACSCVVSDPDEAVLEKESVFGQSFTYEGQEFDISLAGVYQKEKCSAGINALEESGQTGLDYYHGTAKGWSSPHKLEGKIYVILQKPLVYCGWCPQCRSSG